MIAEIVFIMTAATSCPKTEIINPTDVWDQQDRTAVETAKTRCGKIYPDSPCLKKFWKIDQGVYQALCAEGKKETFNAKRY